MKEPQFLPFEEWIKFNPDAIEKEECYKCKGSGDFECECCGHIKECSHCEGQGVIDITRQKYQQLCRQELKKWEEYHRIMA